MLETQLAELGYKRVIIRSGQKPAINKLKETVKRVSDTQIVCEESPVGESKSLGSVNVQIQAVQGMVCTLRDAFESRYGKRLEATSPLIPWLVMHGAGILTRFIVGDDGRTAYQNINGRTFQRELAEFGECVWYLRTNSVGTDKAYVMWESVYTVAATKKLTCKLGRSVSSGTLTNI